MTDTIHLRLASRAVIDISVDRYDNVLELRNPLTNEIKGESANIRNLKIFKRGDYLYIKGSLATFMNGNNIKTLNRKETSLAKQMLEDTLGISLSNAEVQRIDFSDNLCVSNKVNSYFPLLLQKDYFIRHTSGNSLYFGNDNRKSLFYDKKKQTKDKDLVKEYNQLMRIEMSYEGYIPTALKKIGSYNLTFDKLLDFKVFTCFINCWAKEYTDIKKLKTPVFDFNKVNSSKLLLQHLAILGLQALGGQLIVNEMINDLKSSVSPKSITRMRQKLGDLPKVAGLIENPALLELNTLFNERLQNNLEINQ